MSTPVPPDQPADRMHSGLDRAGELNVADNDYRSTSSSQQLPVTTNHASNVGSEHFSHRLGVGSLLGERYELVRPIAAGGMAQVWEGRDSVLSRPVAIKILHAHLATDRGFLLRFRREAIAAARLSHCSIVSIFDTVSEPGVEAIVMELVRGDTLRQVMDRVGRLSSADVVELGSQIADALEDAHQAGIVHRDIKPSNILFCADKRVMVTDFGIAKAGEDTDLTVTGTLLGTAKYLAPEQVEGKDVDPRTDLYSLGILLFEALTGRPPFHRDTDAATALARLHEQPPRASQFQPDVASDLDAIVHQLMEREPHHRFANAVELGAALSGVRPEVVHPDHTLMLAEHSNQTLEGDFDEEGEGEEQSFLRSERSWIVPTLALGLVAFGLLIAGVLISRSEFGRSVIESAGIGESAASESSDADAALPETNTQILSPIEVIVDPVLTGATDLDFQGDGEEGAASVALGIDGNDETSWRTETYHGPQFGRLKEGVGYLVDLGGNARVTEVELETDSRGWSLELYLLDQFDQDKATWGEPIAIAEDERNNESFDVSGTGHFLLIWITDPGVSDDGSDEDDEPDHRFELAEVRVS